MLDFDTMLLHVGEFGLYQKILFTFQAPFCFFVTFVNFGILFMTLYPVNYWCENHFACIDNNSIATAAQRRNISFEGTPGGIFTSDPCYVNEISDSFLKRLHIFSERQELECTRDRRRPCPFRERASDQKLSQTTPRSTSRPYTQRPVSPPEQIQVDTDTKRRRKRHYETASPIQLFDDDTSNWQPGNYDAATRNGQQYGNGQNGQYSGNGYERQPNRDYNRYSTATTSRSPSGKGNQGGFSGSRPTSEKSPQAQPSVLSAYAGWPQPKCKRNAGIRYPFILSNNTVILSDVRRGKQTKEMATRKTCDRIIWDRRDLPYETIVSEGDWWCNAETYVTISQAVFFLGAIVGGFLIGWIADTFGRVPALVIANILGAVGGALSIVSTDIRVFAVFRFITGMAFDNCFTMMYILVLEFCGPSYRTLVANLSIAVFYTLGTLTIPLLAWLIADWKIFALAISLPMLLGILALFFVPESARWLLSKGQTKKATNILRNFAKVNRKKVDERVFVEFEEEANKLVAQLEQEEDEPSLAAAFRTPRLRMTFILLIIFWALIALVYDGHSRNILNLANEDLNVFWMFGIASMTEFPADMLLIFTLDRFGRRWLAFGSMTLSGVFSLIAAAITPEMRTGFLVAAIISRFWVNVAFNIGLQYAAELLPTVIRAQGVNAIHIMGYVASIISPFVAAIGRSNPTLSLILLGACSVTAGVASLFLAETLGEELPNTLEEAEAFGKNQSFWNCPICAKERDEYPSEGPPAAQEDRPVVLRNALRGSIRGETYRSSMISHASSGGSGRSRFQRGDKVLQAPEPTEMTRLRPMTR